MEFANTLATFGTPPDSFQVTAAVSFTPGVGITGSHLLVSARISKISEADFERLAEEARVNCPITKALTGIPITLEASLA
jgi:osmotically inducible protein OsmC